MTLPQSRAALLALTLQGSPQAPLLEWIIANQPEDLALMDLGEDGILQIRELPQHWAFCTYGFSRGIQDGSVNLRGWGQMRDMGGAPLRTEVAPQAWLSVQLVSS